MTEFDRLWTLAEFDTGAGIQLLRETRRRADPGLWDQAVRVVYKNPSFSDDYPLFIQGLYQIDTNVLNGHLAIDPGTDPLETIDRCIESIDFVQSIPLQPIGRPLQDLRLKFRRIADLAEGKDIKDLQTVTSETSSDTVLWSKFCRWSHMKVCSEAAEKLRATRDIQLLQLGVKDLACAMFHGADLEGFDFEGVCLAGANLEKANLRNANFTRADLRKARLNNANLAGTIFLESLLHGASLEGTSRREEHQNLTAWVNMLMTDAVFDCFTILPGMTKETISDLDRFKAAWMFREALKYMRYDASSEHLHKRQQLA